MKDFNDKNINNDICIIEGHNKNKYGCYCFDCNKHLCKECLKSRDHIGHNKTNIIEIQPNKKELDIMSNIIKNYEDKIEQLEKEKLNKTKELNNLLIEYKNKLNNKKDLKIKENEINLKKELKLNDDKYKLDIEKISKKCDKEIKSKKYQYKKNINEKINKYKIINEFINIIYKNTIENLDKQYIQAIQNYNFNEKIENLNNFKRLNEIIYNTYYI